MLSLFEYSFYESSDETKGHISFLESRHLRTFTFSGENISYLSAADLRQDRRGDSDNIVAIMMCRITNSDKTFSISS